jgi:hypothetical protein
MSEITLFSSSVPAERISGSLRKLAAARANTGSKPILRFTKQGHWEYGPESIEIEPTEEWAVNPASFMIGMIGWRGGQVVGEVMFPLASPERVDHDALEPINTGNPSDGWKEQITFDMRHMKDGTEVVFKTTSRGGMNAVAALADAVANQIETAPEKPVPVVTMQADSYKHKQFGIVHTPIFTVVNWADMHGNVTPKGKRKLV